MKQTDQSMSEITLLTILSEFNLTDLFNQYVMELGEQQNLKNLFLSAYQIYMGGNRIGSVTRSRTPKNAAKFILKYIYSFLTMRQRPYYDEIQDRIDQDIYYQGLTDYQGLTELTYDNLHHLVSSTYSHGDRRIGLWALIDRQEDGTIRCAYSNEVVETPECVRCCKSDEEHLVPQSWHKGSQTHPGQDMHQIFIVSKSANGSRGNYVFGEVDGTTPTHKVGGWVYSNEGDRKRFVPHHNVGAVCRATLYTLVAYEHTFHQSYFPSESLEWIINKAVTEPVTLWEKHRNQELFKLQTNRNPFIDHPEWASQIDYTKGWVL